VLDEAIALFARAGMDLSALGAGGRRLVHELPTCGLRVLVVRDSDVPAYVEHGAADVGIVGRDVLEEQRPDVYEPLDLGIGRCRLVVAEPADRPVDPSSHLHLRYATKFPRLTRAFLDDRGIAAEVIQLYGSIELAPLVGLAERIVDLVATGETLRQHRLVELETILDVSSRLIVNRASWKLRAAAVDALVGRLDREAHA
jgi:ATP phosphoribosyltransferase